ncbi:IS630 family transposase [Muricoccus vinaceus]|uniref:IS630 family transposase n=1 Tax=Muricoccus vinaceus TaxID=424704 RepID=A0ABV6J381_9PROT
MQAIAGALEGLTRAEAARLADMERQALRDAVLRYNTEGLAGLHDRPRPGSKRRLNEARRSALPQMILDGPEVETTGLSAWTLGEPCREAEARWGVRYHEGHMSKLVRALGLSRQKARPSHPKADPVAREDFAKKGFQGELDRIRAKHPGKRLTLWFQDEMRFGQKVRVCHRWFTVCARRKPRHRRWTTRLRLIRRRFADRGGAAGPGRSRAGVRRQGS